jgi:hypothetical protein
MPKPARYTVYHITSTMADKSFYFEHHAKAHMEKLNKREARRARIIDAPAAPAFTYTKVDNYLMNVVHMVTRRNMQTGLEYEEPSNTPAYMSPACESYWSM